MKYRYASIFFLLAFLLQSILAVGGVPWGLTPDLILCLVVMTAFLYEGNIGIVFGVLFGLLGDLSFSQVIGPGAIAYMLVALFATELRQYLYRDSILNVLIATVSGTLLYYLIYWSILAVFGGGYDFLYMLRTLPFLLIYHSIATELFYLIVGRRSTRHPQDKNYKMNRLFYG